MAVSTHTYIHSYGVVKWQGQWAAFYPCTLWGHVRATSCDGTDSQGPVATTCILSSALSRTATSVPESASCSVCVCV